MSFFGNIYEGKKVLVTGHTGFKGSWLTAWLLKLGADVCGVSKDIPTTPAMFSVLGLKDKIQHNICDVRDIEKLQAIFTEYQPDFVFHLAAQPIVSLSYQDPLETISSNVLGTANVMDILRRMTHLCCAVIITSDKCYENVEWEWGYRETDAVGGKDIYSGSKGAAEVIFHAFHQSFFLAGDCPVNVATGRAGNVIGGGDWAVDRIVADCMRAWSNGEVVEIRCPDATRPWQHVLEPLSGYLTLGSELYKRKGLSGEQFNFGPRAEQNRTVRDLLENLSDFWSFEDKSKAYRVTDNVPFHEAGLLKLNCDKALFQLKWEANLPYAECIRLVSQWYFSYYKQDSQCMYQLTVDQITEYEKMAIEKELCWCDRD